VCVCMNVVCVCVCVCMKVYLPDWSENCKRYSSLPLGADVSLFCESV
jgi:hypothetical protein